MFPYLGSEIGAPEPERVYRVFRSPETLEAAAASFQLLPIIDQHEVLGQLGTSTDDRPPAGVVGEQVRYEHPYLRANLKIFSDRLKQKILRKELVELSPAYSAEWHLEAGEYEGEAYDAIQVIRAGNHLALVDTGRTGSDVAVLDHAPRNFALDARRVEIVDLEAILAAIAALSDEDREQLKASLTGDEKPEAKDEATPEEAEEVAAAAEEAAEAAVEAVAAEAEGDQAKAEEAAEEAVESAEEALEAAEELRASVAQDAVAMIDRRNAVLSKIRPFVGEVPASARSSAESVAAYACRRLGVPAPKGLASVALDAWLHGRKPDSKKPTASTVAADAAKVSQSAIDAKLWGEK